MNCLSIRKQYYSQYLTFSLYLFPLSYPSVSLNLSMGRMFDRFFNPFHFDYSTIRPLSHVKKILGKFHLVPLSRLSRNGCTIGVLGTHVSPLTLGGYFLFDDNFSFINFSSKLAYLINSVYHKVSNKHEKQSS